MNTLPAELKFSCSALSNYNGHDLKASKPDENGCYEVVLGCVGAPTRAGVIYDETSLINAMRDPTSRFNICLSDGILFGEWGHPDIYLPDGKQDMRRLLKIDESKQSHLFTKIWIDDKPINMHGNNAFPIRAKVKPCGPYGAYLEKSLQDPNINTAFSIRSLCEPTAYSEIRVTRKELENAIAGCGGMESLMISDADIARVFNEHHVKCGNTMITGVGGNHSLYDNDGNLFEGASLIYNRR